ncbi:AAA family ATPase [Providencia sp. PROV134]|uniref:AAA family ATPase n=1 Tax=Providencia sp. PROV134 TaxID=2949844 RepID=UPI00234AA5C9|nr:AAA family ATPase [Providencia sp. PROV134]
MNTTFSFPAIDGSSVSLEVNSGDVIFVVGANGTGKSTLLNKIYIEHGDKESVYILAHRKNSFDNDIIDFSNSDFKSAIDNVFRDSKQARSRYRVSYDNYRTSLPIVKLKNKTIGLAVDTLKSLKNGERINSEDLVTEVDLLNSIFKESHLLVEFYIDSDSNVMASNNNYNPPKNYPISMLSDGEKSALIISCEVLCAKEGATIFLDEPERHLHKRIVSSLIASLMDKRKDCSFVVSTHELTLPPFFKNARIICVKKCSYQNDSPRWDYSIINGLDNIENSIDEHVVVDILGSRDDVLFVEGTSTSLDIDLYSALFPTVSVVSKQKCDLVELAVRGLRNNDFAHRVNAFGIIDNDNKVPAQISNLNKNFVFSLRVHSIESIYYHPVMLRFVLELSKDVNAIDDVDKVYDEIQSFILATLAKQKDNLCSRAVEKTIRAEIMSVIPTQKEIRNSNDFKVEISISSILKKEYEMFDKLIKENDCEGLISRYPVRETNLLTPLAKMCGFIDRDRYEFNVIRTIKANPSAKEFVLSLLGGLEYAISPQV